MLFNSYIFVFAFFPICLIGYYLMAPVREGLFAKCWLIGFSLWFYGYFNPSYLPIILGSICFNYLMHLLIKRAPEKKNKKARMITAVTGNLLVLFYFKYFDFFLSNVNSVFHMNIAMKNIVLPLGISFFTFQQISFVVDTYRGELETCSPVDYALFVSFFPQLIAGPIVHHGEMLPQFAKISEKRLQAEPFLRGFMLFVFGMAKKVLIADTFGKAVDYGYASLADLQRMDCILLMIWYTLQLYFDFSGYCDMAKGIGEMFGIEIPVNFNSPYKAVNIVDFWKRWHITLNRFFTGYVYIPLGGNRAGALKMYRNLLIVYFLSGLWHGAGWNFIFWGMLHGVLYVFTRMWMRSKEKKQAAAGISADAVENMSGAKRLAAAVKKCVSTVFTFLYVAFAWIYFRAPDMATGNQVVKKIFTGTWQKVNWALAGELKPDEFWYVLKVLHLDNRPFSQYLIMILLTVAGLLWVFFMPGAVETAKKSKIRLWTAPLFAVLFIWCVVSFAGVSTFLYFNF